MEAPDARCRPTRSDKRIKHRCQFHGSSPQALNHPRQMESETRSGLRVPICADAPRFAPKRGKHAVLYRVGRGPTTILCVMVTAGRACCRADIPRPSIFHIEGEPEGGGISNRTSD